MAGIHHVTAIAGNPARNLDFYTRVLGLRLVKRTVNFDDPGTYHFYYGDEVGTPGTILTFFPWEAAAQGRGGIGQALQTTFRIPAGSIGHWTERLIAKGVPHEAPAKRFGETALAFTDPDGLRLALVGVEGAQAEPGWSDGSISPQHAIRGFHSVTLLLNDGTATGAILTDVLGFAETGREGSTVRYRTGGHTGSIIDIQSAGGFLAGRSGRGTVHHIAFRAKDDAEQQAMARKLTQTHGLQVTEQRDRQYFRSVYYYEPGGILFEIATDEPGFAIDEPVASLGQSLKLPPFLEPRRGIIEGMLPALETAQARAVSGAPDQVQ
jgi:glyoxalase family protein